MQLAYETAGTGTPIVLLHAFPLSRGMWAPQVDYFRRYGRVILPDLPGFGTSSRQAAPSIADMARQVQALLESLDIHDGIVLGGLSMGGYVAFEFYRQFPDRVKALGLFATRAGADLPEQREARMQMQTQIRAQGVAALGDVFIEKLVGDTTRRLKGLAVDRVKELILQQEPQKDGVADALMAMAQRQDSTELLIKIEVPALLIAGEEDRVISLEEAQQMHERMKNARFEVIERAGHLVNLEQPRIFNETCVDFFQRIGL